MKLGNLLGTVGSQEEFTTTGEMDFGFAAMCRILGGEIEEEKNVLNCVIPIYEHRVDADKLEEGPATVGKLYVEIGVKQGDKRNLRVQYVNGKDDIVVNFGNFDVGNGPERMQYVCNISERGDIVDVTCRSKYGDFKIRAHRYRLYWYRWSPSAGTRIPEEIGTYTYEIGIGSVPPRAIGKRQDKYVWIVPVR